MNLTSRTTRIIGWAMAVAVAIFATPVRAELTAEQKQGIAEVAKLIREAGSLYQQGEFAESGQRIDAAMTAMDRLVQTGGDEVYDKLSPAFPLVINAHALLELEGVMLRPFEQPERPAASQPSDGATSSGEMAAEVAQKAPVPADPPRRDRRRPARSESAAGPAPAASQAGPSFVRQVAPILVQHCGRCHINGTRGAFNMATFALLAKGPPEGRVIFPGDVVASRLIESIETGDMPRGGQSVPAEHLQTLKDWVAAGAKYDGNSPMIPLVAMAGNAPAPPTPSSPPRPSGRRSPTGEETVSFAKDIAPLLLDNCNGCHIDAMQTRGGLRLDDFAALMRGGDSGEIVTPPGAAASLLIRKLKGEEGMRMPAGGRPPLSDEAIGLISTWIEEGAAFDGDSPEQPLGIMASLAWARTASDEELSERRMKLARENLQLLGTSPDQVAEVTTDDFFVVGDVSEATVQAVAAAASKVKTQIKSVADPAAIRGRITLFVLPKRYDYSEFARMVERRSIPSEWQSHWKVDGVDAYVALLAGPSDSDAVIAARLVAPLTSLAVTMRGPDVPRWFAEGAGRAAAAKFAARDLPNVDAWKRALPAAVVAMRNGAQLVKNDLPPEQTDLIGFGVVSTMLERTQRRQYDTLLKGLGQEPTFDAAFNKAFWVTPAAYLDRWKPYAMSGTEGRRR